MNKQFFLILLCLKGQCHEIFRFCFFSAISFPPAPEYPIRTVSKFFENSRRYSQLTGINNTSETGGKICRRRRWYRWQICRQCRWYQRQFCRRCRWHRWQICHRCRWYRWSTLSCEYLREFSKKFETALMVYSGAWGKLIHGKNQKQKISWHCPFKVYQNQSASKPMRSESAFRHPLYQFGSEKAWSW